MLPSSEWPLKQAEAANLDVRAAIKVVGVGGGGNNAVNRMIQAQLRGVEYIAVNTDAQALTAAQASKRIRLGKGLGAGGNPVLGSRAAEDSSDELYEALKDTDMIFITAGMGGGTGTGAAPVIAQVAKEVGALTVAVVTKPFSFEGKRRMQVAEEGIAQLKEKVDTLITIPNDRLLQVVDQKVSLEDAFRVVDDVLRQGIQGISEIITGDGLINLDFADVKAIMTGAGSALMAIGRATGENRAVEAAKAAISSPLLDVTVEGAKGVLFNVVGGREMSLWEVKDAATVIQEAADPEANIIFGAAVDDAANGEIRITLLAGGFNVRPTVMPTLLRNAAAAGASIPAGSLRQPASVPTATAAAGAGTRSHDLPQPTFETDDYEIPAFLRKFSKS